MLSGLQALDAWIRLPHRFDMDSGLLEKNEQSVRQFIEFYERALLEQIARGRQRGRGVSMAQLPQAVQDMRIALLLGKYKVDSLPVLKTCIRLGIKPTKRGIDAFLSG